MTFDFVFCEKRADCDGLMGDNLLAPAKYNGATLFDYIPVVGDFVKKIFIGPLASKWQIMVGTSACCGDYADVLLFQ